MDKSILKYLHIGQDNMNGVHTGVVLNAIYGTGKVRHVLINDDEIDEDERQNVIVVEDIEKYDKVFCSLGDFEEDVFEIPNIEFVKSALELTQEVKDDNLRERMQAYMSNIIDTEELFTLKANTTINLTTLNDLQWNILLLENKLVHLNSNPETGEVDYLSVLYDLDELLSKNKVGCLSAITENAILDKFPDLKDTQEIIKNALENNKSTECNTQDSTSNKTTIYIVPVSKPTEQDLALYTISVGRLYNKHYRDNHESLIILCEGNNLLASKIIKLDDNLLIYKPCKLQLDNTCIPKQELVNIVTSNLPKGKSATKLITTTSNITTGQIKPF